MKKNRGLQSSDPIQSNPQSFLKILTQSNPIQSNPWMDPIHVQLCVVIVTLPVAVMCCTDPVFQFSRLQHHSRLHGRPTDVRRRLLRLRGRIG